MNFIEEFINSLAGKMTTPTAFGWFHLVSLAIIAVLTVFVCVKFKNCKDKTMRIITLIVAIVLILFEIYKQLTFAIAIHDTFAWYVFPFQFCSMPLYILPIIACLKDGKVRDALMSFMSFFVMFAGLIVLIYPTGVFCDYTGINIQTMVHHGLQFMMGMFYLVYNRKKIDANYFWRGFVVFLIAVLSAMVLNMFVSTFVTSDSFNMFQLNPHGECSYPILSTIQANVPHCIFVVAYVVGFTGIAYLTYTISRLIVKKCNKNAMKKLEKKETN